MFVVKHKDTPRSGNNKTILSGYGGFNISKTPFFSGSIAEWVNSGGIYVVPNLRGGSEYGEEWHRAGMLEKKQNVFDDFIAAAEYLIDHGYTRPDKLAIWGGSNGGLLVGTVMVQRPELFGAVVCLVPLLDMIHYDRLKIAKLWRSEYGDPADPEHFRFLYAYSPYHHVKDGVEYPAVFLQTAENDSRVDPMHARKMAARLQSATASERPILLFVEDKAGHGAGKPVNKMLEDSADIFTFLKSILETESP
jgi:prolyl oligopeptidase